MGRRNYIIRARITLEEKERLISLLAKENKTISDLIREMLFPTRCGYIIYKEKKENKNREIEVKNGRFKRDI